VSSIDKFSFSLSHRAFYESFDHYPANESEYLKRMLNVLPSGWQIIRSGIWYQCVSKDSDMPDQGWKLHISATPESDVALLMGVAPILFADKTTFKFAIDRSILALLLSKRWHRGGAGKFITVYPKTTEHFLVLAKTLAEATKGFEGPYILSDRRYEGSRCLFYRYGSLKSRTMLTSKGDQRPYILDPAGAEMNDERRPIFSPPPWIEDPLRESCSSSGPNSASLKGGRYKIRSAVRFSNSGGLYLAEDATTGETVVVKEARPLTNIDDLGRDAKVLLEKEFRLLRKLEHEGVAPRPIDFFQEWEHTFLVEEYLEGLTLRQHGVVHNLARREREDVLSGSAFCTLFRSVFRSLCRVLIALRRNGIIFGDLSPTNVILSSSGVVKIIDFEAACEVGVDPPVRMFTPGFAAADHFLGTASNFEIDYYSLGAVMLSYFMPMHAMLGLDLTAYARFVTAIGREYGVPHSIVQLVIDLMSADPSKRPNPEQVIHVLDSLGENGMDAQVQQPQVQEQTIERTVCGMLKYIDQVAAYGRRDRLFPSDPKVFTTNPLSLAYGSSGIAYALHRITGEIPTRVVDWMMKERISNDRYTPSLYVGMSGIAWVLLELGYVKEAEELMMQASQHPLLASADDLFYGLAGWGMANLKFHVRLRNPKYLDAAVYTGEQLASRRQTESTGCYWGDLESVSYGAGHGASGIALFYLYLWLASGESRFLEIGYQALEFDLAHAVRMGGSLLWPTHARPDRVVVPYWRFGTAGVGATMLRYYRALGEKRHRDLLIEIGTEMDRKFAISPSRGSGLCGLGDLLLDMVEFGFDADRAKRSAYNVASGVMLFGMQREDGAVAFPGADLWKISCDYLTGIAGIAMFLHRLSTGGPTPISIDELFKLTNSDETIQLETVELTRN